MHKCLKYQTKVRGKPILFFDKLRLLIIYIKLIKKYTFKLVPNETCRKVT